MNDRSLIIVTPGFPKDEHDSTCLPSQQLFVLTASKLFPEITFIVISLQYPPSELTYSWNGVSVHALNGKRYKGALRFFFWLKAYRKIQSVTRRTKVLGVLSFWCNEAALIGNVFAKRNAIMHRIWISGQDARIQNRFVRWIKPDASDLVAMSHFLQDEFLRNHKIKAETVIPNAVTVIFQNRKRDIDLIAAGSLIPLKQFSVFVEVIAEVRKTKPDVTAVLFGSGPEKDRLHDMIQELRLSNAITLYNEVDHTTLMDWMSRSKVLVHPSLYEGYSTVCLEALANGCHVISFTSAEDKPIPHWTIVRDKTEMAKTILRILNSETDFTPIVPHEMETTVRSMMAQFKLK